MIVYDNVDGRALRLIEGYYAAGHDMRYLPLTNLLVFEWTSESGYHGKSIWQLDAWFTEAAQDYIIDMIYPRL